jgi:hypothetical protein
VRDELPLAQAEAAWRTLAAAHAAAGDAGPLLWANVESFTWQGPPNNASSPLVPAPWPRVLAQAAAARRAGIADLITFTLEGLYNFDGVGDFVWPAPHAWDLGSEYSQQGANDAGVLQTATLNLTWAGSSGLVGAAYTHTPCLPGYCSGSLTDGRTGPANPYDARWLGLACGTTHELLLSSSDDRTGAGGTATGIRRRRSRRRSDVRRSSGSGSAPSVTFSTKSVGKEFRLLAVHALQVPAVWYDDGSASAPHTRNVSAAMPASFTVTFNNTNGSSSSVTGSLSWPWSNDDALDLYADVYLAGVPAQQESVTVSFPGCTGEEEGGAAVFLSEIALF